MQSLHVEAIDIRTLLTVDLDRDEMVVHELGGFGVFEAFMGHDMAPVAGSIADRKDDRLVLGFGPGEGFIAPGHPVHGVVLVLKQIGAGFQPEKISG